MSKKNKKKRITGGKKKYRSKKSQQLSPTNLVRNREGPGARSVKRGKGRKRVGREEEKG